MIEDEIQNNYQKFHNMHPSLMQKRRNEREIKKEKEMKESTVYLSN
jgi:hypothetical protein